MDLEPRLAEEILAGLGGAVLVADADGHITGWHGEAEQLFGYPAEQVMGRSVAELFPDSPPMQTDEMASLGGAPGVDAVLPIHRRQGGVVPAAVSVRQLPGGSGTVAIVRPMGPELDPNRVNPDWDRTLGRIVRGLVQVAVSDSAALERTDAVAQVLVDQARAMLPDSEVLLSLVPHDRQDSFRIIAGSGPWAETLVGQEWTRAGTVAGLSMQLRRPIETAMVQERSKLRDTLAAGGIVAGRLVPLWTAATLPDGRTSVGVLGFYRSELRYFSPYERRLLGEFSRLASLILQGAELRAVAGRAEERLQRTIEAAYQFTRSLAPEDLLRDLVGLGMAVGADRVTVLRLAGDEAVVLASAGAGADPAGRRVPASSQLIAVAAELGRMVVSDAPPTKSGDFAGTPASVLRGELPPPPTKSGDFAETPASVLREELPAAPTKSGDFAGTPASVLRGELPALPTKSGDFAGTPASVLRGELPAPPLGQQHTVAMPVAGAGESGVVLVLSRRVDPPFPADELALLQTVASIAGVALRNAWLYAQVQEASNVKTEFLNMAAHELRTPLTVIRGYLSMLRDGNFGKVPSEFAHPIELLQEKTDELGRLVDDLLLAARVDAGRLAVVARPTDLNEAVRETIEWARPRARARGMDLRFEPARRPIVVDVDPSLLARILEALVGNALVFHGEKPGRVRVALRASGGLGRVEVEDRGRGIAGRDRERIFERFSRVEDDRYPQEPGTGLGLHIARALAARQRGTVELEWSEVGKGSRFVLSLPEMEPGPDD